MGSNRLPQDYRYRPMKAALALVLLVIASACASQPSNAAASPAEVHSPSRAAVSNGGVIEYVLPPVSPPKGCTFCTWMSPSGIAAGSDGSMWFADAGTNHVGRISPDGAVTWIPVPGTGGGSKAIVAGPDGNIWTVARDPSGTQDWILRITPAGDVTKFSAGFNPARNSGTGPTGITVGPDHNLWFTEIWTDRIGRMTPQGALTEFDIPTGS
jgi:streptogramin lyase